MSDLHILCSDSLLQEFYHIRIKLLLHRILVFPFLAVGSLEVMERKAVLVGCVLINSVPSVRDFDLVWVIAGFASFLCGITFVKVDLCQSWLTVVES